MASYRSLINVYKNAVSQVRSICTTSHLEMSFADKIRRAMAKDPINTQANPHSLTLLGFANEIKSARKALQCKQFEVGRISDETLADSLKQESLIRVLGCFGNTGENLKASQKKEAAKECNCTLTEVENVLGRFRWIKEARKKMDKLKVEGKPMPQNMIEIQKLMGSTATDFSRSS